MGVWGLGLGLRVSGLGFGRSSPWAILAVLRVPSGTRVLLGFRFLMRVLGFRVLVVLVVAAVVVAMGGCSGRFSGFGFRVWV